MIRRLMNNELERMEKEAVMTQLKIYLDIFLEGLG
jgi:hypothetical protein